MRYNNIIQSYQEIGGDVVLYAVMTTEILHRFRETIALYNIIMQAVLCPRLCALKEQ